MSSTTDRIREIASTLHADNDREDEGNELRRIADEIDRLLTELAERRAAASAAKLSLDAFVNLAEMNAKSEDAIERERVQWGAATEIVRGVVASLSAVAHGS